MVQAQTAPAQQAVHGAFLTLPAAPLVRRGLKIDKYVYRGLKAAGCSLRSLPPLLTKAYSMWLY